VPAPVAIHNPRPRKHPRGFGHGAWPFDFMSHLRHESEQCPPRSQSTTHGLATTPDALVTGHGRSILCRTCDTKMCGGSTSVRVIVGMHPGGVSDVSRGVTTPGLGTHPILHEPRRGESAAPPGREMIGVALGLGACAARLSSGVPAGTAPIGGSFVFSLAKGLSVNPWNQVTWCRHGALAIRGHDRYATRHVWSRRFI
jgi:hypothetical protein